MASAIEPRRTSASSVNPASVWPGGPYPLGATWDGLGVNFALFSAHATRVDVCLFASPDAARESRCITLPERTAMVWHRYDHKHNEANHEHSQDGESRNLSWTCGHEGPTDDPEVRALRERQKRNLLATMFLSQGVPMLSGGDELGRTQLGNNNAYCQDNELSWTDWDLTADASDLLAFTARLIRLQHEEPVLCRRSFFQGRAIRGGSVKDIAWLDQSGAELSDREWQSDLRCSGMLLAGDAIDETDSRGRRIVGSTLFVMFNADPTAVRFTLPAPHHGAQWLRVLDTFEPLAAPDRFPGATAYPLGGRTVAVLRLAAPRTDGRGVRARIQEGRAD